MPLIMGILAQAAAAPTPPAVASDYDLLETQVLASDAATLTFSSLNSTYGTTYKHLQIRAAARTSQASTVGSIQTRLNSDTGANYSQHWLYGNGTSVISDAATSVSNQAFAGYISANSSAAGAFGGAIIDILDAFNTSKYSTIRALAGNSEGRINLASNSWRSLNAIDSITLVAGAGANFKTDSRFSLYGLKAA